MPIAADSLPAAARGSQGFSPSGDPTFPGKRPWLHAKERVAPHHRAGAQHLLVRRGQLLLLGFRIVEGPVGRGSQCFAGHLDEQFRDGLAAVLVGGVVDVVPPSLLDAHLRHAVRRGHPAAVLLGRGQGRNLSRKIVRPVNKMGAGCQQDRRVTRRRVTPIAALPSSDPPRMRPLARAPRRPASARGIAACAGTGSGCPPRRAHFWPFPDTRSG